MSQVVLSYLELYFNTFAFFWSFSRSMRPDSSLQHPVRLQFSSLLRCALQISDQHVDKFLTCQSLPTSLLTNLYPLHHWTASAVFDCLKLYICLFLSLSSIICLSANLLSSIDVQSTGCNGTYSVHAQSWK